MANFLQKVDIKILQFINKHCQNSFFDKLMPKITSLGNFGVIWILLCILLLRSNPSRNEGIMTLSSLTVSTIMSEGILKNIFRRDRPFNKIQGDSLLVSKPLTYSFPSGHSSSSFAAAGVLVANNSPLGSYAIALASLIAFSRIYLKVHYPFDVITGTLLGYLCSILIVSMFNGMI